MKKFLCLLLAAVLAGLLILPCAAAEPTDFTDRSTIRNYNAVRMLADLGLVAGYSDGSFGPDKLIRREEVAKLMALLADADAEAQGQNSPARSMTYPSPGRCRSSPTARRTRSSPAAAAASAPPIM